MRGTQRAVRLDLLAQLRLVSRLPEQVCQPTKPSAYRDVLF
jgi:hypothetical protein